MVGKWHESGFWGNYSRPICRGKLTGWLLVFRKGINRSLLKGTHFMAGNNCIRVFSLQEHFHRVHSKITWSNALLTNLATKNPVKFMVTWIYHPFFVSKFWQWRWWESKCVWIMFVAVLVTRHTFIFLGGQMYTSWSYPLPRIPVARAGLWGSNIPLPSLKLTVRPWK